ncbi:hypothetical protein WJ675_001012 [Escherichia coli]
MSNIKQRVEDAKFMMKHERYEGALSLLLSAIDGSAKKIFPEGTISISNPIGSKGKENAMGNKERYIRFLGVRLANVMGSRFADDAYFSNPRLSIFSGKNTPEEKIYIAFRCNDTHEAGLPNDLKYVFDEGVSNELAIELIGNEFRFTSGFLSILIDVIAEAPSNGLDFGLRHLRLKAHKHENIDDLKKEISSTFQVSEGRVSSMMDIVLKVGDYAYGNDSGELREHINRAIIKYFNGGVVVGLYMHGRENRLCEENGTLTDNGLKVAQAIIDRTQLIDIAR